MSESTLRRLSKSQYLRGLQCHRSLWLYNFRQDLRTPPTPGQQHIFDQARKVGELARRRFPGGVLIEGDHRHIAQALQETQTALKAGARVLFEAAFQRDDVLARPDILVRDGPAWQLIEVKSSSEVKDVYLPDVAVQRHVLEGAGLSVAKAAVMHVDTDYVRRGPVDPRKFFKLVDVTALTAPTLKAVAANLSAMQAALALADAPAVEIGGRCTSPYDCDFMDFCWKHVPDYSVYDLKRAGFDKIEELRSMGVMRIEDIPADFGLTDSQEIQVRVAKTGEPHIDGPAIRGCLCGLRWPLYFLDFETVSLAIPPYEGLRPFEVLPFQASLHVQKERGGRLAHGEYLGRPGADPRPGLAEFLVKEIGPKGSVVVYNASFEGARLDELAAIFPKHASALRAMRKRLWDLIIPFRTGLFVHPDMRGSASIKAVLPALVPGMSYENLDISDGEMAFLAYQALMEGQVKGAQAEKTMAALREYCGQDTLAMAEILKVLEQYSA